MPVNLLSMEHVCIKFERLETGDSLLKKMDRVGQKFVALPGRVIEAIVYMAKQALEIIHSLPIGEIAVDALRLAWRLVVEKIIGLVRNGVALLDYLPPLIQNVLKAILKWSLVAVSGATIGAAVGYALGAGFVAYALTGAGVAAGGVLTSDMLKKMIISCIEQITRSPYTVWDVQYFNQEVSTKRMQDFFKKIVRSGRVATPAEIKNKFGIECLYGFTYVENSSTRDMKGTERYYPTVVPIQQIGFTWSRMAPSENLYNLEEVVSDADSSLIKEREDADSTGYRRKRTSPVNETEEDADSTGYRRNAYSVVRCLSDAVHKKLCAKLLELSANGAKAELKLSLDDVLSIFNDGTTINTTLTARSFVQIKKGLVYRTFDDQDVVTLRRPRLGQTWQKIETEAVPVDGLLWEKVSFKDEQLKTALRRASTGFEAAAAQHDLSSVWPPVSGAHRIKNTDFLNFLKKNTVQKKCIMVPDQWRGFGIQNARIDSYVEDSNDECIYRPVCYSVRTLLEPRRFMESLDTATQRGDVFTFRDPFVNIEGMNDQTIVCTTSGYYRVVTLKPAPLRVDNNQIERLMARGGTTLTGLKSIVKSWKLYMSHIEYLNHLSMREANGFLPLISPGTETIQVTDTGSVVVSLPGLRWAETDAPMRLSMRPKNKIGGGIVASIEKKKTEFSHNEAWKLTLRWSVHPSNCEVPTKWKRISRPAFAQHRVTLFPRLAKFLQDKLTTTQSSWFSSNSTNEFDVTSDEWRAHEATSLVWRVGVEQPRECREIDLSSLNDAEKTSIDALQSERVVLRVNENELFLRDIIDDPTGVAAAIGRLQGLPVRHIVRKNQYIKSGAVRLLCIDGRMMEWMVINDAALFKLKAQSEKRVAALKVDLQQKKAELEAERARRVELERVSNERKPVLEQLIELIGGGGAGSGRESKDAERLRLLMEGGEADGSKADDELQKAWSGLQALDSEKARLEKEAGRAIVQIKTDAKSIEDKLSLAEEEYTECTHIGETPRDALVELLMQRLDAITLPCPSDFKVYKDTCIATRDGLFLSPLVIEPSTRFYLAQPVAAKVTATGLRWIKTDDPVNPPTEKDVEARIRQAIRTTELGTNWEEVEPPPDPLPKGVKVYTDDTFCSHHFGVAQIGKVTTLGSLYLPPRMGSLDSLVKSRWYPKELVRSKGRYFKPVLSPVRLSLKVVRDQIRATELLFTHVVEVDGERFKPAPCAVEDEAVAKEDYFVFNADAFGEDQMCDYRFASMSGEATPVLRLRSVASVERFKRAMNEPDTTYETFCDILGQTILYNTIVEVPGDGGAVRYRPKAIEGLQNAWVEARGTKYVAHAKDIEFSALWGHRAAEWKDQKALPDAKKNSALPPPGKYSIRYAEYAINGRVYITNGIDVYSFANTSELAIQMAQEATRIHVESNSYLNSITEFVREAEASENPGDVLAALESMKKRNPELFRDVQTGTIGDKLQFYTEKASTDELEDAVNGGADLNAMLWKKSFSNCSSLEGRVTSRRGAVEESVNNLNELLQHMRIKISKTDGRDNDPSNIDKKVEEFAQNKLELLEREMQTLAQLSIIEQRVKKFDSSVRFNLGGTVQGRRMYEESECGPEGRDMLLRRQ